MLTAHSVSEAGGKHMLSSIPGGKEGTTTMEFGKRCFTLRPSNFNARNLTQHSLIKMQKDIRKVFTSSLFAIARDKMLDTMQMSTPRRRVGKTTEHRPHDRGRHSCENKT